MLWQSKAPHSVCKVTRPVRDNRSPIARMKPEGGSLVQNQASVSLEDDCPGPILIASLLEDSEAKGGEECGACRSFMNLSLFQPLPQAGPLSLSCIWNLLIIDGVPWLSLSSGSDMIARPPECINIPH